MKTIWLFGVNQNLLTSDEQCGIIGTTPGLDGLAGVAYREHLQGKSKITPAHHLNQNFKSKGCQGASHPTIVVSFRVIDNLAVKRLQYSELN